ncbi:heterogeneous nuclear ribonucleoprotein A3 homolog 2 isoform X1 [Drosophila albomicans]|uniref:Heterogeneous nuclear ribonucleoprotein A3 homolog 2 isoform X1 n=1 Tax=Drosophila albomicans TaxID=7291 RepID=A0A6P8W372_DROAB|nr:heterogeneous nuclear ribonucleoprotein A3 homolog 2 isoform X1 [Drosophila albomicans]
MDYGNSGGAEFNWNYSMGGNGGSGQGMPIYPQMGQMGQMGQGQGFDGGQQWLHSNQANQGQSYQSAMPQGQASPSPFDDYNQSMMRYTNLPKTEGGSMGQQQQHGGQAMGMNAMGNSYGGYPGGMSRNGLGNPGAGMGQGSTNSGYGGNWQ